MSLGNDGDFAGDFACSCKMLLCSVVFTSSKSLLPQFVPADTQFFLDEGDELPLVASMDKLNLASLRDKISSKLSGANVSSKSTKSKKSDSKKDKKQEKNAPVDEVLRQEAIALGATEDDLALIGDVDDADVSEQEFEAEGNVDSKFSTDLNSYMKEIGLDAPALVADAESELEEEAKGEVETVKESKKDTESKDKSKEDKESKKDKKNKESKKDKKDKESKKEKKDKKKYLRS